MLDYQEQFLKLMFNEGEKISLVKSKYDTSFGNFNEVDADNGTLCCLNPLNGTRKDENVSNFRNFLIEVDDMSLPDQVRYINSLEMPYSACVFSGNKSLHYGIFLDEDLPTEKIYRYIAQWILNVVTKADQNCKNPTRMIRFPGNVRTDTCLVQKLVELKQRVSLPDLYNWLNRFPSAKPVVQTQRVCIPLDEKLPLPAWVTLKLQNGMELDKSRNAQWFGIGCEFAKAGFGPEETLSCLENFFVEDHDFKRKEWETAVKQGFRQIEKAQDTAFF